MTAATASATRATGDDGTDDGSGSGNEPGTDSTVPQSLDDLLRQFQQGDGNLDDLLRQFGLDGLNGLDPGSIEDLMRQFGLDQGLLDGLQDGNADPAAVIAGTAGAHAPLRAARPRRLGRLERIRRQRPEWHRRLDGAVRPLRHRLIARPPPPPRAAPAGRCGGARRAGRWRSTTTTAAVASPNPVGDERSKNSCDGPHHRATPERTTIAAEQHPLPRVERRHHHRQHGQRRPHEGDQVGRLDLQIGLPVDVAAHDVDHDHRCGHDRSGDDHETQHARTNPLRARRALGASARKKPGMPMVTAAVRVRWRGRKG